MIHHIYVFGPPGTEKTRQIVEENAKKFDTTWNEEWLRLVHGLFDEMENPFLTRNVVQTLSEEFFEGKAQVDVRCHTQVFKGQVYPAVEFSLFDDEGPRHLTLRDAQVMGEVFQRLIQASWCKPLVVAHHELS